MILRKGIFRGALSLGPSSSYASSSGSFSLYLFSGPEDPGFEVFVTGWVSTYSPGHFANSHFGPLLPTLVTPSGQSFASMVHATITGAAGSVWPGFAGDEDPADPEDPVDEVGGHISSVSAIRHLGLESRHEG